MAENLARATPEHVQRLLARFVERVDTADRKVVQVEWTPTARPFFAQAVAEPVGLVVRLTCPQGGGDIREPETRDALAWYAQAQRY